MALDIPENASVILNRMAVYVKDELNDIDPFLETSLVLSIITGLSNGLIELYLTLKQLEIQAFWDTSTGEFLERNAALFSIIRLPATKASGFITLTGVDSTIVPLGTQFTSDSGSFYETTELKTILDTTLSITSLTRSGQIAKAVSPIPHGLSSNMEGAISGVDQLEYNGTFILIVTGIDTFEYTVAGFPVTPATGTIVLDATYTTIDSDSIDFGAEQNLVSGSTINLASPIIGVDTTGFVSFDEIAGGADEEIDPSLRDRFLFRVQNPFAAFNAANIEDTAKQVPGVTRVFIQGPDTFDGSLLPVSLVRDGFFALFQTAVPHGLIDGQTVTITGANEPDYNVTKASILIITSFIFSYVIQNSPTSPATGTILARVSVSIPGVVRIFPIRDNDTPSIIPTPSELQDVKDEILTIKPITVPENDVQVLAAIPKVVSFDFSFIEPNTQEMKDAITANLQSFFTQGTAVARKIVEGEYNSILFSTIDNTGTKLVNFGLNTPVGDIEVGVSELPVLGTIIFP